MSITLSDVECCDLEMILNGAFSPLTGFLNEDDYHSVINTCRLTTGHVWPVPIVLRSNDMCQHNIHDDIKLLSKDGTILAILTVQSKFIIDIRDECIKVAGTDDVNHPYVKMLSQTGTVGIGGPVRKVNDILHFNYTDLRVTPSDCRSLLQKYPRVIGFQTRNPLHRSHIELMLRSSRTVDAHILLSPVVGLTQPGDVDADTRVRCYRHFIKHLPENACTLVVIPLAMRMLGPREALWHALIRKNYGCSHFIIGRDHAGPSTRHSVTGNTFYGPFDAHDFVKSFKSDIDIDVVLSPEIVYVSNLQKYLSTDELQSSDQVVNISGTKFRHLLTTSQPIPDWFSFPEVIQELQRTFSRNKGICIYFIGLSGSGKSTLARAVIERLGEFKSLHTTLLDGDLVRQHLSYGLGFSRQDRSTNVRRIGYVASEIVKHGGICICSSVNPYDDDRLYNRRIVESYGTYIEVFVNTPLHICESRDVKGLYSKARSGEIKFFTGISDPFELPSSSDIIVSPDTPISQTVDLIVSKIYQCLSL